MDRIKKERFLLVDDDDVSSVDHRKHVFLLSQLSRARSADDRHAVQRVRQFYEQRHHSYFFDLAPNILTQNFLNYADILPKHFDGLVLCLWQYSILGIRELSKDPRELQELTTKCNEIFKRSMTRIGSNVLQLIRISRAIHSGNLDLAFSLSYELDQNHCEESSTLRFYDMIKTVLGMIDEVRKAFYVEAAPGTFSRFKVGQLETALPNFRKSQHYDWALPVYGAYFAGDEAKLKELASSLQTRLKDDYNLQGHLSLVNIRKHLPSESKLKDIGVHPLYCEVVDRVNLLEEADLSDEEDVEPSDLDKSDAESDVSTVRDKKPLKKSVKKLSAKKMEKCLNILLEKLVCLIETQKINGGSIDEQLLSKLRLVMTHLMKNPEKEKRGQVLANVFDPVRVRFWQKWIFRNSTGDFGDHFWHFLHPKVNLATNPVALKQKHKFVRMARNVSGSTTTIEVADHAATTQAFSSASVSQDFAKYSPDLNLKIMDTIKLPLDLAYLDNLDPVHREHVILKFTKKKLLYNAGDIRYSRGHIQFAKDIAESLLDQDSLSFADDVSSAKWLTKIETKNSIGRLFYETNLNQIVKVLRGLTNHGDVDKKAALMFAGKMKAKKADWSPQMPIALRQICRNTNYVPFDRQLSRLRSDADKLSEEFSLDPELISLACDKLKEESRRPLTMKALVRYVLQRPAFEESADTFKLIFERYFAHLLETTNG